MKPGTGPFLVSGLDWQGSVSAGVVELSWVDGSRVEGGGCMVTNLGGMCVGGWGDGELFQS